MISPRPNWAGGCRWRWNQSIYEALGREVLAELKAAHPARMLLFDARGGDRTCACDGARMRQVLAALSMVVDTDARKP